MKKKPKKGEFGLNSIRSSFRRVFDTPDGKVVLNYIMRRGNVFTPLNQSRAGNEFEIYRNEGARELALLILGMSKIPPANIIEDHYETRLEESSNI